MEICASYQYIYRVSFVVKILPCWASESVLFPDLCWSLAHYLTFSSKSFFRMTIARNGFFIGQLVWVQYSVTKQALQLMYDSNYWSFVQKVINKVDNQLICHLICSIY